MISEDELARHCIMGDCWLSIENKVYDVSSFQHPGGKQILIDNSGRDATREFLDIGHKNADQHMPDLYVGELDVPSAEDRYATIDNEDDDKTPMAYYVVGSVLLVMILKILGVF